MKFKLKVNEVLHETEHTIRGNEPFLRYGDTGVIVTFVKQGFGNHNFIERLGPLGIPVSGLKKGDVLKFELSRVVTHELTPWQKIKEMVKGLFN